MPHEHVEMHSSAGVEDLRRTLRNHVEPRRYFRISRKHKEFEGEVFLDSFFIKRITRSHNAFVPGVWGKLSRTADGARIELDLRLLPRPRRFLLLWLSFVAVFTVVAIAMPMLRHVEVSGPLADVARRMGRYSGFLCLPFTLLMGSAAVGMAWVGFLVELDNTVTSLKEILGRDSETAG